MEKYEFNSFSDAVAKLALVSDTRGLLFIPEDGASKCHVRGASDRIAALKSIVDKKPTQS